MDEQSRRLATLENARFLREVSQSLMEEIREKMLISRELYRRSADLTPPPNAARTPTRATQKPKVVQGRVERPLLRG